MSQFSTEAKLSVVLDDSSVRSAKQELQDRIGPMSVGGGGGISSQLGSGSALPDGGMSLAGAGMSGLLDVGHDILDINSEILETVEDMGGVGDGGGGGGLISGTLGKVGLGSLLGSLTTGGLSKLLGSVSIGAILGRLGGGAALARLLGVVSIGAILGGLAGGELGKLLGHESIGTVLGALAGGALASKLGSVSIGGVLTALGGGSALAGLLGTVSIGALVVGSLKLGEYVRGIDSPKEQSQQTTAPPPRDKPKPGQTVDVPGWGNVTVADQSKLPGGTDKQPKDINMNVNATAKVDTGNPAPGRIADDVWKQLKPEFKRMIRREAREGDLDEVLSGKHSRKFEEGF